MSPLPRYSANLTGGGLMLPESRRLAALLAQAPSREAWLHALRVDNLLQKNTPATAVRMGTLIRNRLEMLPPEALALVATGTQEAALQTLLAAAVRHSALLRDHLRGVVALHHRRLDECLPPAHWDTFLAECEAREPAVATWSDTTRRKLGQVVMRILAEARYIESARRPRLRDPHLHPDVHRLLQHAGDPALVSILELDMPEKNQTETNTDAAP